MIGTKEAFRLQGIVIGIENANKSQINPPPSVEKNMPEKAKVSSKNKG